MAVLPDTDAVRPVPRPVRAITTVNPNAAGAVGRAVAEAGDAAHLFGMQILDREAAAAAMERDAYTADQIRELLYNPETGFVNQQGRNAVDMRGRTLEQLEALQETAMKGLNNAAQRKLKAQLQARVDRAMQTVETHTSGARRDWINGAAEARATAAFQDGLADLSAIDTSLNEIASVYRGIADRDGWSKEEYDTKVAAAQSKLMTAAVERIATTDPVRAMEFMRDNADRMVSSDEAALEAKLKPVMEDYLGRMAGDQAYADYSKLPANFDWSKHRSGGGTREDAISGLDNQFEISLAHLISSAPPKIRDGLTVYSGYRSVAVQEKLWQRALAKYGSAAEARKHVAPPGRSNHNAGKATDLMWNGVRLDKAPPEVRQWVHDNAGKFGIYFPMAHEPWHAEPMGTRGTAAWTPPEGGVQGILAQNLPPRAEDAAIRRLTLRGSIDAANRKAARDAAGEAGFQMIIAGGDLDALTLDQQAAIGIEGMAALHRYQETHINGGPETDPVLFRELTHEMYNDWDTFRSRNLWEARDQLDDADFEKFTKAQNERPSQIAERAASTLMAGAALQLEQLGLDEDAGVAARLERALLDWQSDFIEKHKRVPGPQEINERVANELVPIVINPPGRGKFSGRVVDLNDVDMRPDELMSAAARGGTFLLNNEEVPSAVVNKTVKYLIDIGRPVTADTLVEALQWAQEMGAL